MSEPDNQPLLSPAGGNSSLSDAERTAVSGAYEQASPKTTAAGFAIRLSELLDTPTFRLGLVTAIILAGGFLLLERQQQEPAQTLPSRPVVSTPKPVGLPVRLPDAASRPVVDRLPDIKMVRPEVFCARMAAFGVVEDRTQPISLRGDSWECAPKLLTFPGVDPDATTSVYTSIRGAEGETLPAIRIKLNELDASTAGAARRLIVRMARSATRSFGIEMPGRFVRSLEKMEEIDEVERRIALSIQEERSDPRRRNLFIRFEE